MKLRIATFNVENLFRRAAILNLRDTAKVDELLDKVRQLQALLAREAYDQQLKDVVFDVSGELVSYVDIRKDAGSLGEWKKVDGRTGFRIFKSCSGRGDWIGEIVFKSREFSDMQRKNTGRVIKDVNADILCAIEVEGMDVLKNFNSQVLRTKKFAQYVMIDSPNDPRGIDVSCLTKHTIVGVRTHVFDPGLKFSPVFSRDCLEVAIDVGLPQNVFVLCNHFKSQSGKSQTDRDTAAEKRKDQARRVVQILKDYDLTRDYVVVLGDLNEDTSNPYRSLAPLYDVYGLNPVVDPQLPTTQRYSYYMESGKVGQRLSQLDYIFLSKPMHEAIVNWGFERRGMFDIENITAKEGADAEKSYTEVTSWDTGASDHAALWVEVALGG